MSKNHSPVLGRKTPILTSPVPFQSPATGRSPLPPNCSIHLSTPHPSHWPLPLMSRNHSPVLGRKTPMCFVPEPIQSPTRGTSSSVPKFSSHSSTEQLSNVLFPLRSNFQRPCCG